MLKVLERAESITQSSVLDRQFEPFATKMARAALPPLVINLFRHYYAQVVAGETGFISADQALPVEKLPTFAGLNGRYREAGQAALERTIVLKLNGGLGTSMGMNGPK